MKYFIAEVTPDDFKIPQPSLNDGSIATILQIVFGVAGGVALVVLTYAALKYVLSRGEPSEVAKAKNTIIYAFIGLGVAAGAFSIVTFVVKSI